MPDTNSTTRDLFISYSHYDAAWVRAHLLPPLEAAGIAVLIDFRDFEPGAPSVTEMERAVLTTRKTLLVITLRYLASEWTAFENILAQTLDPAARQRRVIPLLLERCELPLRIRMLTYLDFSQPDPLTWTRLINAVRPPSNSSTPT
ncbi:MAG: toll/interleukin-1 receptor domain-containing protein [Chloroflexi bacterium]|nr:toll/interleukin-1 receptor domain-containing protein [Chloroflexota bacterium]